MHGELRGIIGLASSLSTDNFTVELGGVVIVAKLMSFPLRLENLPSYGLKAIFN